jgi:hypothetical protein
MLQMRQSIKRNRSKPSTHEHKDFNVEKHLQQREKNRRRQLVNLHYMQECLHNAGISQMQLFPCGVLQVVYITAKTSTRPKPPGEKLAFTSLIVLTSNPKQYVVT